MTLALAVAVFAAKAAPAFAQEPAEAQDFDRWIAEGERAEIPWKIQILPPQLSLDQRVEAHLIVRLEQSKLNRHGQQHDLVLLVRLAREEGNWLPNMVRVAQALPQPLARGTEAVFPVTLLLAPGRHRVGIVLLDRVSGHRSVAVRKIDAKPLSRDPLPELWNSLDAAPRPWQQRIPTIGSQPATSSGPRLVIQSPRPLHIEIVVAFAGYRPAWRVERLLRALEPLAALSVPNGSLRVSALDLEGGSLLFEQDLAAPLDWKKLRAALDQVDPNVVSFSALQNRERTLAFFPEFLQQRLRAAPYPAPDHGSASPGPSAVTADSAALVPRRIFIVLAPPIALDRKMGIPRVQLQEDCGCDVYHLRFHIPLLSRWSGLGEDDLGDSLRPLKPRTFNFYQPDDYRQALAKLLEKLRAQ